MKRNKILFIVGIIGVILFVFSTIIGGFLIENYSIKSQYISETYAIDTEYGTMLRVFGFIPSGILITTFSLLVIKNFQPSKLTEIGFYGLGLFYGISTVITGIFPCDNSCNKEFIDPSISQVIHNIAGAFTYLFVPICILLIGIGLKRFSAYNRLSALAITYGVLSMLFVFLFLSDSNSEYTGIYQRIIESVFLIWIVTCAIAIKDKTSKNNNLKTGEVEN
tara:strand:- start:7768 stop:8430 length:663 start_codon:yes stop_codon:yes gene_type:complete